MMNKEIVPKSLPLDGGGSGWGVVSDSYSHRLFPLPSLPSRQGRRAVTFYGAGRMAASEAYDESIQR